MTSTTSAPAPTSSSSTWVKVGLSLAGVVFGLPLAYFVFLKRAQLMIVLSSLLAHASSYGRRIRMSANLLLDRLREAVRARFVRQQRAEDDDEMELVQSYNR